MKKQKGFTVIELIFVIVFCILIPSWVINVYKLVGGCDFKSDYSCEVKHGIGFVIFPAAIVTVWMETDKSK